MNLSDVMFRNWRNIGTDTKACNITVMRVFNQVTHVFNHSFNWIIWYGWVNCFDSYLWFLYDAHCCCLNFCFMSGCIYKYIANKRSNEQQSISYLEHINSSSDECSEWEYNKSMSRSKSQTKNKSYFDNFRHLTRVWMTEYRIFMEERN